MIESYNNSKCIDLQVMNYVGFLIKFSADIGMVENKTIETEKCKTFDDNLISLS